jgi:hypothetical protein
MAFPIFVVYKHVPGQEQPVGRVVVDVRELNDTVIPDAYLPDCCQIAVHCYQIAGHAGIE